MLESLFYLVSSFWLGALHAATPGHGKTIAASYIVGARGRPADAVVLGIFVTLSHTSGIVLVGVLATMGSAWLVPQRVEAYLAVGTGLLVIAIGLWMLRTQRAALSLALNPAGAQTPDHIHLAHRHSHGAEAHTHDHEHDPEHAGAHGAGEHGHAHGADTQESGPAFHSHGWGPLHTHDIDALTRSRPSLPVLLGLGVAGGLLPDPGALAILLSAIASGKLILGLVTVLVFSLGFASVLVVVGVVAARVGELILAWLSSRWIVWLQMGAAVVIVGVGVILTANGWRLLISQR